MSKQRIFLAGCFLLFALSGSAQNRWFNQGFGLAGSGASVKGSAIRETDTSTTQTSYSLKLLQFGITYYPRIDLVSWKGGSISVGSPVMLGFSLTAGYRSTDRNIPPDTIANTRGLSGGNLAFTVPVVADLNIGLHSAADETGTPLGLYVGGGYAYNYTKVKTTVGYVSADCYESVLRGGIRLGRSWENRFTIGFTIRGAFMDNAHPRTYEFQLVKDL